MEPTERILDLLSFLLASRRPVTSAEIFEAFARQYTGNSDACERKFSRDKEILRSLGIPLVHDAGDEGEDAGYRIDRSAFFLPDIALSPEERAALFAVGAAAAQSAHPLRGELPLALTKLRAGGGEEGTRPAFFASSGRAHDEEQLIARAVHERRLLEIIYPPENASRVVAPYAFSQRRGRLAIVGFCHLRNNLRTFYADRMTRCVLAAPRGRGGEFDIPEAFDPAPHLPTFAWQICVHEPLTVQLAFEDGLAEIGPRTLGIATDGRCETTNLEGLVSLVLALGPGVRIVGPERARQTMRTRLTRLASALLEAT